MKASSYEEVASDPECSVHGELEQKRKTGTWTKRVCAIWQRQFLCFKSEVETKPQVFFSLDGFHVTVCSTEDRLFAFQLSKPGVVDHVFATDSSHELDHWIQKLTDAGVTPTSKPIEDQQSADEKTDGALNSQGKDVISDEVQDCSEDSNFENAKPEDTSEQSNEGNLIIIESLERDTKDNFPSLDVSGSSVSTPLIHTSQSFDESNLKKLESSPVLFRSNEIENLLSLNEEDPIGDEGEGLQFKTFRETISSEPTKPSENFPDSSDKQCDNKPSEHSSTPTEQDNLLLLDVCEPNSGNCHSESKEDNTRPIVLSELPKREIISIENNEDRENSELIDLKVNNNNTGEADLDLTVPNDQNQSLETPPIRARKNNLFARASSPNSTNEVPLNKGTCNVKANQNSNGSKNPKPKVKIQQQIVGSLKKPETISSGFENQSNTPSSPNIIIIEFPSAKNPPPSQSFQSPRTPSSTSSTVPATAPDKNKIPPASSGNINVKQKISKNELPMKSESNGNKMDVEAQVLMNVSVKELKGIFSQTNGAPNNIIKEPAKRQSLPNLNHGIKKQHRTTNHIVNPLLKMPYPQIESYVNIAFDSSPIASWQRSRGILSRDLVQFYPFPETSTVPVLTLCVRGLEICPAAWDTGRLLAFKLVDRGKLKVIVEPEDVESLGRWVSSLFRVIQDPAASDEPPDAPGQQQQDVVGGQRRRSRSLDSSSSSADTLPVLSASPDSEKTLSVPSEANSVSVKEIRALFEDEKLLAAKGESAPRCSSASSANSSVSSQNCSGFSSLGSLSHPNDCVDSSSPIYLTDESSPMSPNDSFLNENGTSFSGFKKTMEKLEAKYADVVCWLGRYIEQDEEQKVLSGARNPFLAKLRLRHKLELIARLEMSGEETEKKIQTLKDRLAVKEMTKGTVAEKFRGRLIRNAEDARRVDDEKKRIERECANMRANINKLEKDLSDIIETIEGLQQEIQAACEKFEWINNQNENDDVDEDADDPQNDTHEDDDQNGVSDSEEHDLPEWTKKAKEKAQAWRKLSDVQ